VKREFWEGTTYIPSYVSASPYKYIHDPNRRGQTYRIRRRPLLGPPKEYFLKLGRGEL
jgi:hypothetical protein